MKAIFHHALYKIFSLALALALLFGVGKNCIKLSGEDWNTNYAYVFVHGLSGWGSYDAVYKLMPYWGMFGGDLMEYLNQKGFHAYAASVDPTGSAWDRACELYAQLTGTRVDYGKAHSERCGHARFGTDFTGKALIPAFGKDDKINLLGHSFGGATVRMFAAVMASGSAEERAATAKSDLSPYFAGGKADWIYSLTTLAAPHNGTSAYHDDEEEAKEKAQQSPLQAALQGLMNKFTTKKAEDRIESDHADYNMNIDHALALNQTLPVSGETYYFSYACSCTKQNSDGTFSPVNSKTELMFRSSAKRLGRFTDTTEGGFAIDETWFENDGLVNTISAKAPFDQPQKDFDAADIPRGVWNVMPVYDGDHMALEGGLFLVNDVKPLYVEHLSRINAL